MQLHKAACRRFPIEICSASKDWTSTLAARSQNLITDPTRYIFYLCLLLACTYTLPGHKQAVVIHTTYFNCIDVHFFLRARPLTQYVPHLSSIISINIGFVSKKTFAQLLMIHERGFFASLRKMYPALATHREHCISHN